MYIDESTMTIVDNTEPVNMLKTKVKTLGIEQVGFDKKDTIMIVQDDRSIKKVSIYSKDNTW